MPDAFKSLQQRRWREAGLRKLGLTMQEYDKYLQLPHWQSFRKLMFAEQVKKHGHNFCQNCGATPKELTRQTALHVHHLTYERLGNELLEDVMISCRSCHEKEHGH